MSVGIDAGAANAGSFNSFVGWGARNVSTGSRNSFFGSYAGIVNSAGEDNSFFGTNAGRILLAATTLTSGAAPDRADNQTAITRFSVYARDFRTRRITIRFSVLKPD